MHRPPLVVLALAGACAGSPLAPSTAPAAPTVRLLFCAYGGVGMTPDPLPAGYETEFAVMVVEVDNPGPVAPGVAVQGARLLDSTGAALSSLRRVDHLVVMPPLQRPGPSLGIFAVYLNPEGTPFGGDLGHGRTTLRVRMSLDHGPAAFPARCQVELGHVGAVEGVVNGSWPT